jgi:hypothetical protein
MDRMEKHGTTLKEQEKMINNLFNDVVKVESKIKKLSNGLSIIVSAALLICVTLVSLMF